MKMGREKFVPLLFIGGQFGLESFQARIVRAILLLHHVQPVQFAGLNVRRTVQLPLDADQDDVREQDDGQHPADHVVAM